MTSGDTKTGIVNTVEMSTFIQPFNKTRVRKPNFSNDEIDCLLELVNQHRDILLTNDHKAHSMRQKQLIWQQVAEDVTLNGDRLCQRDANDVRQKWKDLVRWANRDMVVLHAAKENNQSLPSMNPYTNRVLQIKNGVFDKDSMYSSPSQVGIRNHHMDIKNKPDDTKDDNGEDNPTRASASGWQSNMESSNSTDSSNPKFSSSEIRCLISMYDSNKSILKTDSNDDDSTTKKKETWIFIAEAVSEISTTRTPEECLQKWDKFLEQAKKEEIMEKQEEEKGGSFPKSPFTDLILKVDRTEAPVVEDEEIGDEFWDSIEDNTEDRGLGRDRERENGMAEIMNNETPSTVRGEGSGERTGADRVHGNDTTNGESGGVAVPHSYSTRTATSSIRSRPFKVSLSNKSHLDFSRKRKRPLSTFMNSSRLGTMHTSRSQQNSTSTNGPIMNGPLLNHVKDRHDFESHRRRLELQRMELENALLQSQREKIDLEKHKLRLEMANLEQEREKIIMEKNVAAKQASLLEKQLMGLS